MYKLRLEGWWIVDISIAARLFVFGFLVLDTAFIFISVPSWYPQKHSSLALAKSCLLVLFSSHFRGPRAELSSQAVIRGADSAVFSMQLDVFFFDFDV